MTQTYCSDYVWTSGLPNLLKNIARCFQRIFLLFRTLRPVYRDGCDGDAASREHRHQPVGLGGRNQQCGGDTPRPRRVLREGASARHHPRIGTSFRTALNKLPCGTGRMKHHCAHRTGVQSLPSPASTTRNGRSDRSNPCDVAARTPPCHAQAQSIPLDPHRTCSARESTPRPLLSLTKARPSATIASMSMP